MAISEADEEYNQMAQEYFDKIAKEDEEDNE